MARASDSFLNDSFKGQDVSANCLKLPVNSPDDRII
jgi:hypothetical protein